ncbi:MAG: PQQ-like beta-propeller repeat protein [Planctomycetes bacterium]|nr:PQQ-like beta-propeller repeat protein [Planctomycetota bacterium]
MRRQRATSVGVQVCWRVTAVLVLCMAWWAAPAQAQWPQWGGPNRDFSCDVTGLAEKWPEAGPAQIWSREIGGGHSSIVVDDGVLYTMCRRDDQDAVLALNAADGKTVWETRYDAPTKPGMQLDFGAGPHSTPLVVGERVFTIGAMTHFHCLDKRTGKILWKHDLAEEMNTSELGRGYGASPFAYNDTVIVVVGPRRPSESAPGIAAFNQETGEIVWTCPGFGCGYASPILAKFNGEDHLIVALGADRAGLDPATGKVRWRTQVDFQEYGIMATPLWIEPDLIFFSAGYGGGTRLFRLSVKAGEYQVEDLWYYRKMQIVHGTMARIGDYVYGSSHGSFGPAFMMAIDLRTGKPAWRKRGLTKSNLLYADGKFIILDEEGNLVLATATPEDFEIHARAKVLERLAWTCPTLVGTRLYLRDHRTIKCLDLGAAANQ